MFGMALKRTNQIKAYFLLHRFHSFDRLDLSRHEFNFKVFFFISFFLHHGFTRKTAGLYGNDDLHNGLLEVLTAGRKVDNIISSVRNQTQILESTLATKIRPQLVQLADIFDQPASNQTALSQLILSLNIVQGNATIAKNAAADIRRPLMHVTITSFLSVRN